ncbi:hypothetical protein OIU84_026120 [Salix udensis]|uniref:Uncharacterized protein n=1 Tax=Salix udensis TaxID=889485 RepID=A0AAD6KL46_9ROSI|nr:hypothetical protein OIU84_026120 [Salix udensis]
MTLLFRARSPTIWFVAILFLLSNTHGLYSYLWLPFIPLIVILLVSTKLQIVITQMGLRIQDTQNAFQFAFFAWTWYEFGLKSCFHKYPEDLILKMGTTMRPTIFNERFAKALRNWHHTAKQHIKQNRRSGTVTPATSALAPHRMPYPLFIYCVDTEAASPMACRHHPDLLDLKPVAGVGNKTPVYKHRKHDGVEDREALVLTSTPTPFIQSDDFQRHIDMTDFYLIS